MTFNQRRDDDDPRDDRDRDRLTMTLSATLPSMSDAERERARLRLGTALIEHVADLWPQGEPAATPEWIRAHAFDILTALEQMFVIGHDARAASRRRIPHRLHWLLWLLADLDESTALDG
jgi:hypothetical protein